MGVVFQSHSPIGVEVLNDCNKMTEYAAFEMAGKKFCISDSVYLPPDTYKFSVKKSSKSSTPKVMQRAVVEDDTIYPEHYRKSEYIKGSNSDVPKPFQIGNYSCGDDDVCMILHNIIAGKISKIFSKSSGKLQLSLDMFYR